jgi:anti-sigma B factor antagonist
MDLTIEKDGNVTIVTLPPDQLDAGNVAEFKRDVAPLIGNSARVVIDLSRLRFVDSSGLGAMLSCLRQLNASGGELKLCGMARPVRALFELVRMHRVFDIHATRDEAVRAMRQ